VEENRGTPEYRLNRRKEQLARMQAANAKLAAEAIKNTQPDAVTLDKMLNDDLAPKLEGRHRDEEEIDETPWEPGFAPNPKHREPGKHKAEEGAYEETPLAEPYEGKHAGKHRADEEVDAASKADATQYPGGVHKAVPEQLAEVISIQDRLNNQGPKTPQPPTSA
jgi:hypothetical protein